jgi:DNA-binding NarL/FixJ family response regulator
MNALTVFLAEAAKDQGLACRRLLEGEKDIRILGKSRNPWKTVQALKNLKPRILLMDIDFVKKNRGPFIAVLRQASPETRIIIVGRRSAPSVVLYALSNGALGYLQGKAIGPFLIKAVRAVHAGEVWVSRKMGARLIDRLAAKRVVS